MTKMIMDSSRDDINRLSLPLWDKESEQEEVEMSEEVGEYNNRSLDETKTDIVTTDGLIDLQHAFSDPYQREDDNIDTNQFALWNNILPQFAEKAKLDQYKHDIKIGNKQYKDFYIHFKENFLQ